MFKNSIDENSYVKICKSNKQKDDCSISSLIKYSLSQSECIKLGVGVEHMLKDFILSNNVNLKDMKPKNKKNKKEKDHLFIDETNKEIYYAEIKTNLKLDTEKRKETIHKVQQIEKELQNEYPNYHINMYLVGARYYTTSIIPSKLHKKYEIIRDNLCGINEYFNSLKITSTLKNENEYIDNLNYLTTKLFKL